VGGVAAGDTEVEIPQLPHLVDILVDMQKRKPGKHGKQGDMTGKHGKTRRINCEASVL
jgi:hypothetical protein